MFQNDEIDNVGVTESGTRNHRVANVVLEPVIRCQDAGDATLGVVTVGLAQDVFRHYRDSLVRLQTGWLAFWSRPFVISRSPPPSTS